MSYRFGDLSTSLGAIAREFDERGFVVLDGAEQGVTRHFLDILTDILGSDSHGGGSHFLADKPVGVLPRGLRAQLARVKTSEELAGSLISAIGPLLERLIGPLGHVSSTFHSQFKGEPVRAVDHGGYAEDHLEVHGPYLLHQDFTGANIPTSPSAVTLWAALNSSPDWTLRLFPGSHRRGLLCNRWLELDDPRVAALGAPVDVTAQVGRVVLFNALILHGSSNAGPRQRVSCDIRFFPVCGFLPSPVRRFGHHDIGQLLGRTYGAVLRAPLLESEIFLGRGAPLQAAPPHSVLNWVNVVNLLAEDRRDDSLRYLERFTNTDIGVDRASAYAAKFLDYPIQRHHGQVSHVLAAPRASREGTTA